MFDLAKRTEVVSAVATKYDHAPFELGTENDCVHMIDFGLKEYGIKTSLSRRGSYSTEAQARRAMKRAGFDSLADAVDAEGFMRLESAATAWPGDIIAFKGDNGDIALAWMASEGRAFGFLNGYAQFVQPIQIEAAWRVEQCL